MPAAGAPLGATLLGWTLIHGGPVVAVAAPLAKVEGGDGALRQKPDENHDRCDGESQRDAADRKDGVQDVQREWWAENVERRPRPGPADHREANRQCLDH